MLFVEQKGKPICLIYNESVSVNKEYNLKDITKRDTKATAKVN